MFIRNIIGAFKLLAVFTFVTLLASCGGGGGGGDDTKVGADSNSQYSTLASVSAMAATDDCPNGGITVDGGIDSNGNSVLDPDEVTSTQYVCNGADGSDGISSLVAIVDEAAGENCSAGGKRITVGQDLNDNGILEESEIVSHDYVCNGANGANGTNGINGSDGHDSLIKMEQVSSGEDCALGGTKVTSGLDENNNGILDQSEITYTTYICNGATGPGITWETKYASFTAQRNKGYLVDSASMVTATIPLSSALNTGDIIAIDGIGSGGWTIAQNVNQRIITKNIYGPARLEPHDDFRQWWSVASSADGTKLAAVVDGGLIYTSIDSGVSWTLRDPGVRPFNSIASSADGTKLVAVTNAYILTSTDSGVSWTIRNSVGRDWYCVASSSDGSKLIVGTSGQTIYTSADSGITWSPCDSVGGQWQAVASSDDGTKLVAVLYPGQIYTSTNSGVSWTGRDSNRYWQSVASSADGSKLVAVVAGGQIYTSADSGVSWTPRESSEAWRSVASSADGSRLFAGINGGQIYTSTDFGVYWSEIDQSGGYWLSLASSADGNKLVAANCGGCIYTLDLYPPQSTTPGTDGFIYGSQYDYIELQYIGNDTFNVLDYIGYDLVVH